MFSPQTQPKNEPYSFFSRRKVSITILIIAFIGLIIASVSINRYNQLGLKIGRNVIYSYNQLQIGNGFLLTGLNDEFAEYGMDLDGEISGIGIGRYSDEYSRLNMGLFRKNPEDPDVFKIYFIENSEQKKKRKTIISQAPFTIAWENVDIPVGKIGINVDKAEYELHVNGDAFINGNLKVSGNIIELNKTAQLKEVEPTEIKQVVYKSSKERFPLSIIGSLFQVKQFTSVLYDTENTTDLKEGEYIINVSGYYQLDLNVVWYYNRSSLNTYRIIQIRKNESIIEVAQSHTVLGYEYDEYFMSCSVVSRLEKGDKIATYILSPDPIEAKLVISAHKLYS